MLRGTKVKVNGNEERLPVHLVGKTGIALARMVSGHIRVLTEGKDGFLVALCYPEESLDIVEPPVEL